jgi:general secretion pathway protein J
MRLQNLRRLFKFPGAAGFSLLEVLVAMAIFSMVALITVQGTTSGFKVDKSVTTETEFYQNIRTALWQIERDISLAFHASPDTKLGDYYRRQTSIDNGVAVQYKPSSFFIGTAEKLNFSSSSHKRMYKDTKETDTCEIGLFTQSDEDDLAILTLRKRESTFIDHEFDEGGIIFKLLDNVNSVKFRYFTRKGFGAEGKWLEKWDSTDGEFRFLFPEAVEVSIVVPDPFIKDEKLTFTEKIKVLNPNNLQVNKAQQGGMEGLNVNEFQDFSQ